LATTTRTMRTTRMMTRNRPDPAKVTIS
jgi:hypothetical protein